MDTPLKSPHLDRDWLHQKYIVEGLSTYEIGAIVGRDPKRVYEKLKDFGIPTRPRGLNLKSAEVNYMKRSARGEVDNPFKGHSHSDATKAILSEKAKVPKPYIRGERNGMSGRTGESNPNYKDGSAPERQRLYASAEWKAVIRAVYKRDGYKCLRCGSGHVGKKKLHAHHIKPWAGNPDVRFDLDNLVTLCRECHEWVHSSANLSRDYLA